MAVSELMLWSLSRRTWQTSLSVGRQCRLSLSFRRLLRFTGQSSLVQPASYLWRRGVAVTSLGVSQRGYSTSGPVSTGMGDRLWRINYLSISPSHPVQLSLLPSAGNEYQPKCGDALRLGSKGRYGSFHSWINVWVAGKTVRSLVNTCHTWSL